MVKKILLLTVVGSLIYGAPSAAPRPRTMDKRSPLHTVPIDPNKVPIDRENDSCAIQCTKELLNECPAGCGNAIVMPCFVFALGWGLLQQQMKKEKTD